MALPSFFNLEEEVCDSGYETLQDFFLQWNLHCAHQDVLQENERLHQYAKKIALNLLFGKMDNGKYKTDHISLDDYEINEVKTWRQWKNVDLIAEIELSKDKFVESHVLNIENKWYTSVRPGQLEKSRDSIKLYYSDKTAWDIKNVVIYPDYEKINEHLIQENSDKGYHTLALEDLFYPDNDKDLTGNDLFDEYWFRSWNK